MKEKISSVLQVIQGYVPAFFKNFYVATFSLFVVWMIFFDANNLFVQIKQTFKYKELLQEKKYYEDKILEVKEDMKDLQGDERLLEKFAREKYYFQKENEDVYVVVEGDLEEKEEEEED